MTTCPEPDLLAPADLPLNPVDRVDGALVSRLTACRSCRRYVTAVRILIELAQAGGDGVSPAPPRRVWERIVVDLADIEPVP